jgi:hypothetical protein
VEGEGYQCRLSRGDLLLVLLCHYGTDNTTWLMIDDGLFLPHSHVLNIVSKRSIQPIFFGVLDLNLLLVLVSLPSAFSLLESSTVHVYLSCHILLVVAVCSRLLADVTCCWTCLCCLPRISSFSGTYLCPFGMALCSCTMFMCI